jgi:hypothetical protein
MTKWAKLGELSEGDTVKCSGLLCLEEGGIRIIKYDMVEGMYIDCYGAFYPSTIKTLRHYIDAQLDDDRYYVGLEKIDAE